MNNSQEKFFLRIPLETFEVYVGLTLTLKNSYKKINQPRDDTVVLQKSFAVVIRSDQLANAGTRIIDKIYPNKI